MNSTHNDFGHALISDGPSDELQDHAEMYRWLIGAWNVRAVDYLADGNTMETSGEWYFSWVLEGRAIQDVWIAPKRSLRTKHTSRVRNRYGSSLRIFDVNTMTWTVLWFNPVSGARDELQAQRIGNEVVQRGEDKDGNLMRWVFTDIQEDSFRWYGERSMDKGHTWVMEAEFFGTKM